MVSESGTISAGATYEDSRFASPVTGVSEKYKAKFAQIDAKGGGMTVVWNWWAFFFPPLWYLFQGLWAKFFITAILIFISGGILALPIGIYTGLFATYDYYLWKKHNKQLW